MVTSSLDLTREFGVCRGRFIENFDALNVAGLATIR